MRIQSLKNGCGAIRGYSWGIHISKVTSCSFVPYTLTINSSLPKSMTWTSVLTLRYGKQVNISEISWYAKTGLLYSGWSTRKSHSNNCGGNFDILLMHAIIDLGIV
ncbi:hypothetical protein OGATHE_004823 [Ogataea polymorpha]|uniref:Uncharacterized protein n=1 Tax=Ogataea polymorpha TaxID=460523 RepID=A0A9P8P154_9ASCO|nr:hypothetical protein OGATHE_004823 [Ogataea polymorpha]